MNRTSTPESPGLDLRGKRLLAKLAPAFVSLSLVAFALLNAGAAAGADYSIQAQTLDGGGGQASSISYGMTSSIGNIGGSHSSSAAGVTIDSGYVAQIATLAPGVLANIATRLAVQTGDNVLIGGFIIDGTAPKQVLIRGIGPSLTHFGVINALADPVLELHLPDGSTVSNDNWKIDDQTGQSQEAIIRATSIPPTDDVESAILITLNPGAYTAILSGKNQTTGIGLVEVYDVSPAVSAKLANISTRGFVNTADNAMIGGFIVVPPGSGFTALVIRAIGPSLAAFGVTNALADPVLELHDSNGGSFTNDNWRDDPNAALIPASLQPKDPLESATYQTLPPGAYTVIVRGANNTTGVGLVEVYALP
jgi:predicted outer membrane lipoprotein